MARPRKTETRQSVTIRLGSDLLAELDERAATAGITRTELIETALRSRYHVWPDARPVDCDHPKAERQVHGWGTVCGACNKRL